MSNKKIEKKGYKAKITIEDGIEELPVRFATFCQVLGIIDGIQAVRKQLC